jgi:UDP-N-acetylmuramoyl-tripeptide--D-alanyl-D-alanine ligase
MDIAQDQVRSMPQHYIPMPGRTRIIPGIKQSVLLDDSYNSSPAAAISALKDLGHMPLKSGQRRAACLGEMRELGGESANLHRRVGAEAARSGLDLLVCCGTFSAAMAEGAIANGMDPERVKVIEDTPEAGLFIQKWLKTGDVVLAKASQGTIHTKGVRMERVIKELMAEPLRAKELLVRQDEAWQRT